MKNSVGTKSGVTGTATSELAPADDAAICLSGTVSSICQWPDSAIQFLNLI